MTTDDHTPPTHSRPRSSRRSRLASEGLAGLSGAIASVPDGLATAILAGANPMAGLYASFAAPIAGGALTSTRVMVIATTSAAAVTTSGLLLEGPDDPVATLATLTVVAGVMMLAATALGAVRLMRFVSASVMAGFLFGIGLILILGQLPDAVGVEAAGGSPLARAWSTLTQIGSLDVPSAMTAVAAIGITWAFARGRLLAVAPLIGVVVPMVALSITGISVATVQSVGTITTGLPPLTLPDPALITPSMLGTALALTIVVLVQTAGVAVAYPNPGTGTASLKRDFFAQGTANVASAVTGGIPVGASVGQTAVNYLAGGRSRVSVIASGIWMLLFIVLLGPLIQEVPIPALAGLLMLAGLQALRPRRMHQSWQTGKASATAALATLIATLVAPIQIAVLIGVILSLLLAGVSGDATVRVIGLAPTRDGWRRQSKPQAIRRGHVTVVDVEGVNSFTSVDRLFRLLPPVPDLDSPRTPAALVLRMRGFVASNLTFSLALERYAADLAQADVTLVVCGLSPRAHTQLSAARLPSTSTLLPAGEVLEGSLQKAYEIAQRSLDPSNPPPPP